MPICCRALEQSVDMCADQMLIGFQGTCRSTLSLGVHCLLITQLAWWSPFYESQACIYTCHSSTVACGMNNESISGGFGSRWCTVSDIVLFLVLLLLLSMMSCLCNYCTHAQQRFLTVTRARWWSLHAGRKS